MAKPPSFHEWLYVVCDWRISSGAMRGKRYTFDAFPCQTDMVRDDSPRQVVIKSAQMAVSEHYTLARPMYHLDAMGANYGILFPTQQAMRNFYRTRIKGALAANPYLFKHTKATNEGNVTIFDRELYLRYTTTETAIATFDADAITVDEQDFHNQDSLYGAMTSRQQGAMGDTYWYDVSTPSYPMFGIHKSYLTTDQCVWLIRCASCGHENDLTQKIGEYDLYDCEAFFRDYLGAIEDWRDYHIPCSSCGKPIDPVTPMDRKNKSLGGGRWVARYPKREDRGYHLQIFQRRYTGGSAQVLSRVRRSLLRATEPEHVRRWWNFTIGVPFQSGEGRLAEDDLERVSTNSYAGEWVADVDCPTIYRLEGVGCDWVGVDVRSGQYHVVGLKRLSENRVMVSCAGWCPLSGQLLRLWERLGEPVLVIDALPDTSETRNIVKAIGRRGRRAQFSRGIQRLWQESGDKDLILVSRPRIMEALQSLVRGGNWVFPTPAWKVGSGCFQARGNSVTEETLADHFKAPSMVRSVSTTTLSEEYDFPKEAMNGIDPHFYMAGTLAYLATQIQAAPAQLIIIPR